MTEVRTGAIFSDLHAPDHNIPAWNAFLEWCRVNQPDEIISNGDMIEFESMSSHPTGTGGNTVDMDVGAGEQVIGELVAANNSSCEMWYIEGNHETRGKRKARKQMPEAESLFDVRKLLNLDHCGIKWVKEGDGVQVGKLLVLHGYYYSKHHAAKHLDAYKCDVAYGHTHRPQIHTDAGHDEVPMAAYGLPCMRTLRPGFTNGCPTGWSNGFGIYNYAPATGQYNLYVVLIDDGKFMWQGRMYGE